MNEIKSALIPLIENQEWKKLKSQVEKLEPYDVAELFEELSERDKIIVFRLLNNEQTKDVFKMLSHEKQQEIIDGLAENANKITRLLNDIEPDDRTAFLAELPGEVAQKLIQQLSPEQRAITNQLLGYPKDSIGRLMTTEYVAVRPEFTVEETFQHIRKFGHDSETLNVIYVVDENWKLIDDLRIKELILADPNQIVDDLINHNFKALKATDDQEEAIKKFKNYDRVALPVLSEEGVLIGIVTFDDIMDIADNESSEDFHKFGAIRSAISNPLKARVFELYKNRVVWLLALVFMNLFSGAALESFENVIQSVVALVFFLPLLIDSGGNAGSQTATLMIRSLAMGDVKISDWYKLIGKELVVSLFLGVTMAAGVSLVASFRAPEVIGVVAITMVLTVLMGSIVGLLLPFIFTKLKLDPATASAPLITSIADISGVLIYFSIASWWFGF
ncbi:magnesium transporter [Brumimicrobium glaciale]|uniref:Magnesium transporter MgtE n=1 Tax=Brumimicrobium glaciale TaxID=200475 RepID=A0A4Q4KKU5_9FLAO|nr:magnesium transporter [Brumimicrobium glaciale]RYM32439.1 magnesium transporter [Brumimicrobium glaciale]